MMELQDLDALRARLEVLEGRLRIVIVGWCSAFWRRWC